MTNTYRSLINACHEAGTNITAVCKRAGIPRMTITNWKNREPKSFLLLEKLKLAIQEEKKERAKA